MRKYACRAGQLSLLIGLATFAKNLAAQPARLASEAKKSLLQVLSDPLYRSIDLSKLDWSGGHDFGDHSEDISVILPEEDFLHPNGLYGMLEGSLDFAPKPYHISSFDEPRYAIIDDQATFPTKEEGITAARQFMNRQFPWFFAGGQISDEVTLVSGEDTETYRGGLWQIEFRNLNAEGLSTANANVQVRTADNKIVGFFCEKVEWPPHKFPFNAAKSKALDLGKSTASFPMSDLKVDSWHIVHSDKGPKFYYCFKLVCRNTKTGKRTTGELSMHGDTGELVWQPLGTKGPAIFWAEQEDRGPFPSSKYGPGPNDSQAFWTPLGLGHFSRAQIPGLPAGVRNGSLLALTAKNDLRRYLTCGLNKNLELNLATGKSWSPWVGIQQNNGWTYSLNLRTGDRRVIYPPDRNQFNLDLSSDGEWSVSSLLLEDDSSADRDLFVKQLPSAPMESYGTRLLVPGPQTRPLFSPDGEWLYFLSESEKLGRVICRIRTSLLHGPRTIVPTKGQVETVSPKLPAKLERISISSDSKKILLQLESTICLLDVATRSMTRVRPEIQAGDTGPLSYRIVDEACLGPTNDELTFTVTEIKKGQMESRIFCSKLDGSGVHAVTPADRGTATRFVFPESGKDAYHVTRDLVTHQSRWWKAHTGKWDDDD